MCFLRIYRAAAGSGHLVQVSERIVLSKSGQLRQSCMGLLLQITCVQQFHFMGYASSGMEILCQGFLLAHGHLQALLSLCFPKSASALFFALW